MYTLNSYNHRIVDKNYKEIVVKLQDLKFHYISIPIYYKTVTTLATLFAIRKMIIEVSNNTTDYADTIRHIANNIVSDFIAQIRGYDNSIQKRKIFMDWIEEELKKTT